MIERQRLDEDRKRAEAFDALARPVAPEGQDDEGYREIRTESDVDGRVQAADLLPEERIRRDLEGLEVDEPDPSVEEALRGEGDPA